MRRSTIRSVLLGVSVLFAQSHSDLVGRLVDLVRSYRVSA
jgi:hypothetical protein